MGRDRIRGVFEGQCATDRGRKGYERWNVGRSYEAAHLEALRADAILSNGKPILLLLLGTEDAEGSQSSQPAARAPFSDAPSPWLRSPTRGPAALQTRPLRAPSSLFSVVPGDGFGDELLPGQGRLRLTVRAGGEKSRHGDGAEGLRSSRPEPEETRGVRVWGQPRLPSPDPDPRPRLHALPVALHGARGSRDTNQLNSRIPVSRRDKRDERDKRDAGRGKTWGRHFPEAPKNALNNYNSQWPLR